MLARTLEEMFKPFKFFTDFDWEDPWTDQPFNNAYYDEETKTWTVEVELPGMTKDDVSIKVVDGNLVVSAKNEELGREFNARYYLGKDIDQNSMTATMENGLLLITAKVHSPEEKIIKIK